MDERFSYVYCANSSYYTHVLRNQKKGHVRGGAKIVLLRRSVIGCGRVHKLWRRNEDMLGVTIQ